MVGAMTAPIGLAVTLRVRIGAADAYQPSGVVDPARILGLLNDVATELMIRLDGDEGMLRALERVEMLAPVFVGDYIEATGVLSKLTPTTRQVALEARKVITYARSSSLALTAADALSSPPLVCRAIATCSVPRAQQRRPRIVMPALPPVGQPSGRLPEGNVLVTPPPDVIVTPARETPPEIMLAASIIGAGLTRDHTPHVPVTAEEIAQEAKRCRDAGACIVHLGVSADDSVDRIREAVAAIRGTTDVLVVVSSISPGPFDVEKRLALAGCDADYVTLAAGSFNYASDVVETPRSAIRSTAMTLRDRGGRGLAECYELSHLDEATSLGKEGLLGRVPCLQFVFGVPGAIGAAEETIRFVASRIPRQFAWFFAGVGRHQRKVTELAVKLGGHVRAGLADNIYLRKGVLAEGSAPLVDRLATFSRTVGRDPVSPERARILLGLVAAQPEAAPPAVEVESPVSLPDSDPVAEPVPPTPGDTDGQPVS